MTDENAEKPPETRESMHFHVPIPGPDGPIESVVWGDDATWTIHCHRVAVPGLAGGDAIIQIPQWSVKIPDGGDRVRVVFVPLEGAYLVAPMEWIGKDDQRQLIPAANAAKRRRALEKAAEGGEPEPDPDRKLLLVPGTGTRQ